MALPDEKDARRKNLLMAGRAASAGYFFIVAMGMGAGGGWLLDRYVLHAPPWGLLGGFFVGIVTGFRELYLIGKRTTFPRGDDGSDGGRP